MNKYKNLPAKLNQGHYIQTDDVAKNAHGIDYQVLVALWIALGSIKKKIKFDLRMEAEGYGNFEDVVVFYKGSDSRTTSIEAIQNKHSRKPYIARVNDLMCNSDGKKELALHKYFHRWFKDVRPEKKGMPIKYIFWTNMELDDELKSCISNEQFSKNFIQGNLPKDSKQEKIRELLFDSIKKVKIYNKRKYVRTDDRGIFYDWEGTEEEKDQLIIEFLSNLYLQFGELYYTNLQNAIKDRLDQLIEGDSEPIFNAFYMDFRAWLRERRGLSHSDESIKAFLEECKNKYILFREAHGISTHILNQKTATAGGIHFQRKAELLQFCNFINSDQSLLLISGTAGSGRLSLIKRFFYLLLENKQLHSDNFLVLDGSKLNREAAKFIHIPFLKFIIIYNIEYALQDTQSSQILVYLANNASKHIKLIYICLPESIKSIHQILKISQSYTLTVNSLSLMDVISNFPFLKKYEHLPVVTKLLTNPAKLILILKYWEALDKSAISELNELALTNYIIDTYVLNKKDCKYKRLLLAKLINQSLKDNTLTIEYFEDKSIIDSLIADNILISIDEDKYLIADSMYIDWYIDQKLNERFSNVEEEEVDNEIKALMELLKYHSFYHVKNWCKGHPEEFSSILKKLQEFNLENSNFDRLLTLITSILESNSNKYLINTGIAWLIENWKNKILKTSTEHYQIQKLAEALINNAKLIDLKVFEELIDASLNQYATNDNAKLLIDMILSINNVLADIYPEILLNILERLSLYQLPDYYPLSPFQGPFFEILLKLGEKPDYLKRIIYLINRYVDEFIDQKKLSIESITIGSGDQTFQVKGSYHLWCLYRGYPLFEVPSALIACLMSLELCIMSNFAKEINNASKRMMLNSIIPIIIKNSSSVCTLAIVISYLIANKEEFSQLAYGFLDIKEFLLWDHQRKLNEPNWRALSENFYIQQDLILPEVDFHLKVKAQSDKFPYRHAELLDLMSYLITNLHAKANARLHVNKCLDKLILGSTKSENIDMDWLCILYTINELRSSGYNLFQRKLEQHINEYNQQKEILNLHLSKVREVFPSGIKSEGDSDEIITHKLCEIIDNLESNEWFNELLDTSHLMAIYYKLLVIYCYMDYLDTSLKKDYLESLINELRKPLKKETKIYQLQFEICYKIIEYLPLMLANSTQLLSINNLMKQGIVQALIHPVIEFRKIAAKKLKIVWNDDNLFVHHCTLGLIQLATLETEAQIKEEDKNQLVKYFLNTDAIFEKEEIYSKIYEMIIFQFMEAVYKSTSSLSLAFRTLNCALKLAFVDINFLRKNAESSDSEMDIDTTDLEEKEDTSEYDSDSSYILNQEQPLFYLPQFYFRWLFTKINQSNSLHEPMLLLLRNASSIMLKLLMYYSVESEFLITEASVTFNHPVLASLSKDFWKIWELFLLQNHAISVWDQYTLLLSPNLMDLHETQGYSVFVLNALKIYKNKKDLDKHIICSLLILSNMLPSENLHEAYQFIEELLNNNSNLDLDEDICEFIKIITIRINEDLTGYLLKNEKLQKVLYKRLERFAISGVFSADILRRELMEKTRKSANLNLTPMEEIVETNLEIDDNALDNILDLYKLNQTSKPKISMSNNSFFKDSENRKLKQADWQNLALINNIDYLIFTLKKNNKHVEILENKIKDSLSKGQFKDNAFTIELIMSNFDLILKDANLLEDCKKLRNLQQEIQTYKLLIEEQATVGPTKNFQTAEKDISITVAGQTLVFTPKPTLGDGWCAFYAAGLNKPIACIDTLLKNLGNKALSQDLAYAILQNYISSLPIPGILPHEQDQYIENFNIDKSYKLKIIKLYQKWDEADEKTRDEDYKKLMQYLSDPVVIKSYLTSLKRSAYANIGIVKAYMEHINHKSIGIIVKYGAQYYADIPPTNNENTSYVLFDPSQRMLLAHYTELTIKNNNVSTVDQYSLYV